MISTSERLSRLARSARSPLVWIVVLAAVGWMLRGAGRVETPDCRGIERISPTAPDPSAAGSAAGLFIGVQRFTSTPPPADVEYAVDDAVDLAHAFSKRIDPAHIAIAINGEPQKPESKRALQQLIARGAKRHDATKETIACLVRQQTTLAGSNGELFLSFATHGFTTEGVPYVLGSTSTFEDPKSAISAADVMDIAARVGRSFIVLDACRERMSSTRGGNHRIDTRAADFSKLPAVKGQVVFAPAAGQLTNDGRGNGVFTGAILDGLDGKANCNRSGFVTAAALHDYVERRMMRWRRQRDPDAEPPATQLTADGNAGTMPLARCGASREIGRIDLVGSGIVAFDKTGKKLWGKRFEDAVFDAKLAEAENIVIAAVGHRVRAFDADGEELWTQDLGRVFFIKRMIVQKLRHGARATQVAVLANSDDGGSRVAMWDADGVPLGAFSSPQRLLDLFPVRLTARHAWKLATASKSAVMLLDPRKLEEPVWTIRVPPPERSIRNVRAHDLYDDGKLDLAVTLGSGSRRCLDFAGHWLPDPTE